MNEHSKVNPRIAASSDRSIGFSFFAIGRLP